MTTRTHEAVGRPEPGDRGDPVTEAQVRRRIAAHLARYGHLRGTDDMFYPFDAVGPQDGPWTDLRPSEAARLCAILEAAETEAFARCEAMLVEAAVSAALRFAAECPDAPRAVR